MGQEFCDCEEAKEKGKVGETVSVGRPFSPIELGGHRQKAKIIDMIKRGFSKSVIMQSHFAYYEAHHAFVEKCLQNEQIRMTQKAFELAIGLYIGLPHRTSSSFIVPHRISESFIVPHRTASYHMVPRNIP